MTDEILDSLRDAFVAGFMLEHGFKSASRYPLSGKTDAEMAELLRPAFEAWTREALSGGCPVAEQTDTYQSGSQFPRPTMQEIGAPAEQKDTA